MQRLTQLGCEITDRSVSRVMGHGSVTSRGSPQIAVRLALIFPHASEAQSLVILVTRGPILKELVLQT